MTGNIETEKGHNTSASLVFFRHAQKSSGQVFEDIDGKTQLSVSLLSPNGIQRASEIGRRHLLGRNFRKAYATNSQRTVETLKAMFDAAGIAPPIQQPSSGEDAFFTYPESTESERIAQHYKSILEEQQKFYLDTTYPGKVFSELTSDQQEVIAELAEEHAIVWYLDYCNTPERRDSETPTTRERAAAIAYTIETLIRWTDRMPNGTEVSFISCGHKTSTEAFLMYCIIRPPNESGGLQSIADIGGSLKILDGWEFLVSNDESGNRTMEFSLIRQNGIRTPYLLDQILIAQLASEHMEKHTISEFPALDQ